MPSSPPDVGTQLDILRVGSTLSSPSHGDKADCPSSDGVSGIPSILIPRKYQYEEFQVGAPCTIKSGSVYMTASGRQFLLGCYPVAGEPGMVRPNSCLGISYEDNIRKCVVFCESTPRCVSVSWIPVYNEGRQNCIALDAQTDTNSDLPQLKPRDRPPEPPVCTLSDYRVYTSLAGHIFIFGCFSNPGWGGKHDVGNASWHSSQEDCANHCAGMPACNSFQYYKNMVGDWANCWLYDKAVEC